MIMITAVTSASAGQMTANGDVKRFNTACGALTGHPINIINGSTQGDAVDVINGDSVQGVPAQRTAVDVIHRSSAQR